MDQILHWVIPAVLLLNSCLILRRLYRRRQGFKEEPRYIRLDI